MTVAPLVAMPDTLLDDSAPQIPAKMYFRIGEVSRLLGVPAYVLRFWETEFRALSPKKSGRGHRLYRRKDVELFYQIKQLLYEKRFTIEGARKSLRSAAKQPARKAVSPASQADLFAPPAPGLDEIRKALREILRLLDASKPASG
jgi:DNA-binding transcriptional MerR regulator